MNNLRVIVLGMAFVCISSSFVYAMAGKPAINAPEQNQTEPSSENTETVVLDPNQVAQMRIQQRSPLTRVEKENVLLTKIMKEIQTPEEGAAEVLRQEKLRQVVERVNRNIDTIERIRKDQEEQLKRIRSQQAILQQHKR